MRQHEPEKQRSADMSMQVVSFNARVVLRPAVRAKIKRRLKEAIRLIVTRGAAVEESGVGPKLVFRVEDIGADKWIAPGECVPLHRNKMLLINFYACRLDVYGIADHGVVPHAVCRATWPDA